MNREQLLLGFWNKCVACIYRFKCGDGNDRECPCHWGESVSPKPDCPCIDDLADDLILAGPAINPETCQLDMRFHPNPKQPTTCKAKPPTFLSCLRVITQTLQVQKTKAIFPTAKEHSSSRRETVLV
jgi:hypothetical protein